MQDENNGPLNMKKKTFELQRRARHWPMTGTMAAEMSDMTDDKVFFSNLNTALSFICCSFPVIMKFAIVSNKTFGVRY